MAKRTINEIIQDLMVGHMVDLTRYSNATVRKVVAALNRADPMLYEALTSAIERLTPKTFTVERLDALTENLRSINAQAFGAASSELFSGLRSFVDYEAEFHANLLRASVPQAVAVSPVVAEAAYAQAFARPFQGVLLRGVLLEVEATKAKQIRRAIIRGFTEGTPTGEIVRTIRGTKAAGYTDGLMEGSRREIEAVARTALGHMSGFVADRSAEQNADLIKAMKWSATLDTRTSSMCRIRDGKLYDPVTHKPQGHALPWGAGPGRFHWNCRSAQIPVLKSYKDLGVDIPDLELSDQTRASMDGQVPSDETYGQWLEKQSATRQDEILGPNRGKLLRDGKLKMEDLYNQKGVYKTLDELRESDAAAFKRAGL